MNPFFRSPFHAYLGRRRYPVYAVVHAHTGDVISIHLTRPQANAAKADHDHRVRGLQEVDIPKKFRRKTKKKETSK